MKKNHLYIGFFFILIGVLLNEKILVILSPDRALLPSTVHNIRIANILFIVLGIMSIYHRYWLPKNRFVRTVLFYVAFLIVLEMGARYTLFHRGELIYCRPYLSNESWSRILMIHRLQWGFLKESDDKHHPIRGWAIVPNLRDFKSGQGDNEVLSSNSKGIRGTTEYSYKKPDDKFRILTIGDSLTFGREVADDQTYPHYLNEMLPQTEVINLGVGGYGHDQMLLYLKEEGIKYKPDLIVLGFVQDDMLRNNLDFCHYYKPRYRLINGQLQLTNIPIPTPKETMRREKFRLKLLDVVSLVTDRIKKLFSRTSEIAITEALLNEIHKTAQNIGADFVMVYLPIPADFVVSHKSLEKGEKFFNEYCRKEQIQCLSLKPGFEERIAKGEKLITEGHWDATSNHFIAARIKEYLQARQQP